MAIVVIAEDEPDILSIVTFKLDAAGYTVHVTTDGASAFTVATAVAPDLVLLDVVLPGLGGLEVCRSLRAAPPTADLPVMLISARADDGSVRAGFDAGADDYLTKPFSPREMMTRIDELLTRPRARALAARAAARAAAAAAVQSAAGLARLGPASQPARRGVRWADWGERAAG